MFRKLFKVLRRDTLLDRAYERSFEMLDMTHDMFAKSRNSLMKTETGVPDLDINALDIQVNKYEREVRRNVHDHLTSFGAEDLYAGLALISIIIDVERIGDYTKNIMELAINHPAKLQEGRYAKDLKRIEEAVEDSFQRTKSIFNKSDAGDAKKLLEEYYWINPLCDKIAISYIKEEDNSIPREDAVTLALYFRFLKRINSHLRNIATSVVNPFDKIGFVPKDIRKKLES